MVRLVPKFKTQRGTTVYGGGGIYPDVVIKELPNLTRPQVESALVTDGERLLGHVTLESIVAALARGVDLLSATVREVCETDVTTVGPDMPLDEALHLIARNVGRALEVHVLDPVGDAGKAGPLVAGADPVPAPDRHERRGVNRADQNLQSIIEVCLPDIEERRRCGR